MEISIVVMTIIKQKIEQVALLGESDEGKKRKPQEVKED